jgi:hypothetical protein
LRYPFWLKQLERHRPWDIFALNIEPSEVQREDRLFIFDLAPCFRENIGLAVQHPSGRTRSIFCIHVSGSESILSLSMSQELVLSRF